MFTPTLENVTVHHVADLYTTVRFEGSMNSATVAPAKRAGSFKIEFDVEDSAQVTRKGTKTVRNEAAANAFLADLAAHAAR